MALIPRVRTERRTEQVELGQHKVSPLEKVGSVAGAVGSVISGNPFLIGASAIQAARAFGDQPVQRQTISRELLSPESTSNAMSRRVQFSDEDPLESLRQAKAALGLASIDPETRKMLEKPLIRALSAQQKERIG